MFPTVTIADVTNTNVTLPMGRIRKNLRAERPAPKVPQRKILHLLIALLCLLTAGSAFGGVEVRVVNKHLAGGSADEDGATSGDNKEGAETSGILRLDQGNLAMDLNLEPGAEKGKSTAIFQGGPGHFLVVNHEEQFYSVMDDEAIQAMAEELENAMMMLDEKMAGLPPEQRKLLRDSLMGDQKRKAKTKVVNTGEVATKAGFSTRKMEVRRGDELLREVWVVDWSQVPEGEQIKSTLLGLEGFFLKIQKIFDSITAGSLGGAKPFDMGESPFQDLAELNGFPVLTRNYDAGKVVMETRVDSIDESKIPETAFQPPNGYSRRTMSGGR